jgi:hypothetical protein
MRERAHLAGGWLTAGPDGEQFRVTAFIPYLADFEDSSGETNTVHGHAVKPTDLQLAAAANADRND